MEKEQRILQIITYPHPALQRVSDPITNFGEETRQLVDDLYRMAASLPAHTCAGLAAPQIGVNKRVFIALGRFFINPTLHLANGRSLKQEGCFSSPEGPDKLFKVWRNDSVWITYYDLMGKQYKEKFNGFMAEVLQHEFDHLNGVMCSNREDAEYKK
jgi:peptide deformylase